MRIIRPVTITAAMLTACNVPETVADAAAYAAGTTYALEDVVSVASTYNLTFYKSLQGSNTGNTPASSPTWWREIGTGYLAWSSGTTYVVGDRCTYNHKLYECLIGHTSAQPDLNTSGTTPKWLDLGYSNRWKMFDDKVGSQTELADSITLTIAPGQVIDSIAFLDLEASTISITMTDPTDGVVYTEIVNLVTQSVIVDGYSYFFEPIITTDAAVLLGIPPYGSASIEITISYPGGTAKIGTMAVGMQKELGKTLTGASYGIQDYSKKEEDDFGNFYVLERAYSKSMECEISTLIEQFDDLNKTLSQYRATPLIFIGTDYGYSSFIIYGFVRSFSTVARGPVIATCSLKIIGLS